MYHYFLSIMMVPPAVTASYNDSRNAVAININKESRIIHFVLQHNCTMNRPIQLRIITNYCEYSKLQFKGINLYFKNSSVSHLMY